MQNSYLDTQLKRIFGRLIFAGLFMTLASIANATQASFNFSGTSTNNPNPFSSTLFAGSVTYDTASYTNDILIGSASIGGDTWTYAPKPASISNLHSIYVYNDVGSPAFDTVDFFIGVTGPNVTFGSTTYRPSYLLLSFGQEPNVLQSSAIPSDPNVLNGFSQRYANLQFEILDAQGTGTGQFTGLAYAPITVSAVPEADTYAMMLAGFGLIGFIARRRKLTLPTNMTFA